MAVHVARCLVEARADPAVGCRELEVAIIQRLRVHEHVTRRIPELVAEVLVALDTAEVESDIPAGRGQRGVGEA